MSPTCEQVMLSRAEAGLEAPLPPELEGHAAECATCRASAAAYRELVRDAAMFLGEPVREARAPRRSRRALAAGVGVLMAAGLAALVLRLVSGPAERVIEPRVALAPGWEWVEPEVLAVRRHQGGGLEVQRDAGRVVRLELASGRLGVRFHPLAPRPLVVTTPGGTVEVLGTVFEVGFEANAFSVAVEEGRVRVTPSSGEPAVILGPGESFSTAEAPAPRAPPPTLERGRRGLESPGAPAPTPPAAPLEAAAAEPSDPLRALEGYAEVEALMRRGEHAAAARWLEARLPAVAGGPVEPLARLELGKLYVFHLGRMEDARRVLTPLVTRQDAVGQAARELLQD